MVAIPAVAFAGLSKAGLGGGAAFVSSSILALVLEPGEALGIMLPLLMLADVFSLKPYWKRWNWPASRLLIIGAVPGIGLGGWLYTMVDADSIRLLIGVICVAFVLWQVGVRPALAHHGSRAAPDWVGLLAGVMAGFTSFVSHAGGPPVAAYMLSQNPEKTEYQATTVLVFWVVNAVKFIPYAFLGMFTLETLRVDLILAPFMVLGVWAGVKLHRAVPSGPFFALTYLLLAVTGLRLIWLGLSQTP
ncbi:sulfite exporter TauE/SafE family protein [Poseidonocella sedimentorum]|uniref:Probable membrane transporter protein n=1 Tax=Poseidonocella sedimentorum TaxID=871652 RepID=A0A1I6DRU8_9RHOB|nr:sulfite exporter TauE/SafE family protein [Poseidonocella sedimentorum]SFR08101.1 hypothetical protein SAMN04515673_1054 [Poseidonocella sedimentorum]